MDGIVLLISDAQQKLVDEGMIFQTLESVLLVI